MVESVAKYRNLDERPNDKDETKIVTVGNYLNTSLISSQSKLTAAGINPVVIGNGTTVVSQYPKKGTKVSQKSKVFLLTNGKENVMPDIRGWSSSEVTTFASILKIPLTLNGYGYVTSTNIPEGAIIDSSTELVVNLENIDAGSLVS